MEKEEQDSGAEEREEESYSDPPPRARPLLERLVEPAPGKLWARWIFLRALAAIFFSAFFSLAYQIQGLIGPTGILPAKDFLEVADKNLPFTRYSAIPTLLWFGAGHGALTALWVVGMVASVALFLNLWPRLSIAVALVCFLSFISAAQDFASYQSDGMLLEAAFISLFFAPPGVRPRLGASHPPSRAAWFLLVWEWFRIYFESGLVKILSGDPTWRDFTAMDHYYENGPLPTWIGWYVQHWPEGFHKGTAVATLLIELVLVWLAFVPGKARLACFSIVTPLQVGIILTANYAFLNYIVLFLGFLLLEDAQIERWIPFLPVLRARETEKDEPGKPHERWKTRAVGIWFCWMFYATIAAFFFSGAPDVFTWPATLLDPFRFANRYGLFAVMTPARYEIEFQGTTDGEHWIAYPFRYKPQALDEPPGIYAPYQPRFEWNLWFASLSSCRNDVWVLRTEARLLDADPYVLSLFASNPFPNGPPKEVRTVAYQYWFTTKEEKRATGRWWRRDEIGPYCPTLSKGPDGRIRAHG